MTQAGRTEKQSPRAIPDRGPSSAPRPAVRAAPRWEERLARRGGVVELLCLPALLHRAAVRVRNAAYDRGWLPSTRLVVPVISVGNLSTGGTGKTPLCAFVARELAARGWKPGFLSRGYRAAADGLNEEAHLLERACPGVPHVQDPDRVRGGRALVQAGVDAIVLDDGFQHRRLRRDLDLVLVDATRPWGLPRASGGPAPVCALLPRGFMREPLASLARADAILLSRTEQVDLALLEELERAILRAAPGRPILRTRHRTRCLVDERGLETDPGLLAGLDVDLVSAIGNPDAFEKSVRATGAIVREHRVFPDHHAYRASDLEGLGGGARKLVTTAKDAVKLGRLRASFMTLEIEIEIESGVQVLNALLDALPRARASMGAGESSSTSAGSVSTSPRNAERWSGAHA